MAFNGISCVLCCSCERLAIRLGNEPLLPLIWLFDRNNPQLRTDGLISLMAARRQNCSNDESDRRNARTGGVHTMSRCSRSWERALAGVGFGLLALDGPAVAADLPVKAPHIQAVFDWTGLYIGAHTGYSRGASSAVLSDPVPAPTGNVFS